ncbi:glycosyltransferase family A protein [Mucilaginibacter panaciglaebae]
MKKKSNKQAFLILSDCVSESLIRLYLQVKAATVQWGDTFIVYHNRTDKPEKRLEGYEVYEFTNAVMTDLGYTPVSNTLVPGSNHFPIIKFHLDYPDYDYYWCIEDDVVFNGTWSSFFNTVIKNIEYDFISSFIKYYTDNLNPNWYWWDKLTKTDVVIDKNVLAMSFNPIYSLSNRAAKFLDQSLKSGWTGHHEVLMATLLISNKFKVKDFGGALRFVPPGFKNKYYTGNTHLWRPSFKAPGELINKIYHPVKNKFKITDNFKFKISFCITGIDILGQLKQTLVPNILDNQDYDNFEFVILDHDTNDNIERWIKEHLNSYIDSKKIVYYKTVQQLPYNHSCAKNLAFKLASGDIICSLGASVFIGKGFAVYLNDQFKINNNIVISSVGSVSVYASTDTAVNDIISVKKDDFLYIKGFNGQLSTGAENIDFLNRLELSRIKPVALNCESDLAFSAATGFSLENAYITLDKTLVQHIDPATSNIIYMYHTGNFEMGTVINNAAIYHADFRYSYLKRNRAFEYDLKTKNWTAGTWRLADNDETLIFKTNNGDEFQLAVRKDFYETNFNGNRAKFYNIAALDSKRRLVDFHYLHKNKNRLKNIRSTKGIDLNNAGFGNSIVYKNFNQNHPVITGDCGKEDNRWLSTSIFISRNKWHSIIKNVIKPLVNQLFSEGDLVYYKLGFNYQSGENIRFSLLVDGKKKRTVAQIVDQCLNNFFKAKNLSLSINNDLDRTSFMLFHKNSVQYGLYSTIIDTEYEYLQSLEQAFSTCIMEAFANDVVDDELILTFVLYVLFNCHKVIKRSGPEVIEKWLDYNGYISESLTTTEDNSKLIQDQYEALSDAVNEIYSDVVNGSVMNDLAWINTWEDVFNNTWKKVLSNSNPSIFFCQLDQIINQQLNTDINFRALVNVFINKTLDKDKYLIITDLNPLVLLK